MKIFLLLLAIYVPFVFSIYKGKAVQGENHSFVVSLQTNQGDHFCCGALITLKFILTAGSCVRDRRPHEFMVLGGITRLNDSSNGTRMLVDKVISANVAGPRDIRNNIALLYLMEELSLSLNLRPIALANDDDLADKVGESCRIYGWGKRSKRVLKVANTLQNAVTKIGNQAKCRQLYTDYDGSLLCIFDANASLCLFDTGNPLISDGGYYLWAISTEIHWCGNSMCSNQIRPKVPQFGVALTLFEFFSATNESYYDIYTRVDWHREWIQKHVNEHSASPRQKQDIFTGIIVLLMTMLNQ